MSKGILLRGSMGVGKTTTMLSYFNHLTSLGVKCARIPSDGLMKITNHVTTDYNNLLFTARVMSSMFKEYQRAGYYTIMEGVFYNNKLLTPLLDVDKDLRIYRLVCSLEENLFRDEGVGRTPNKGKVLVANKMFSTQPLLCNETLIDTSNKDLEEVIEIIKNKEKKYLF